jgi:hypothetical protein
MENLTDTYTPTRRNAIILAERVALLNERNEPRVGDFLKLPHGDYQRFTQEWEDRLQTGSTSASYHIGKRGEISYSGGLDWGVLKRDIKLTEEVKDGSVWFFSEGLAGIGRGVTFYTQFKVYELRKGANTSGLPTIKEYAKKLIRDKAETITRINGNGNEYTLPLPCLRIVAGYDKVQEVKASLEKSTKLIFEVLGNVLESQIMTHEQFDMMQKDKRFKATFYNNATYKNTLILQLDNFK